MEEFIKVYGTLPHQYYMNIQCNFKGILPANDEKSVSQMSHTTFDSNIWYAFL